MKTKLNKNLSQEDFEKGYFYATELKEFAKSIGVKGTAKLRKDQLEKIIKHFLSTGLIVQDNKNTRNKTKQKDYHLSPLRMESVVNNYCSDKLTKTFIKNEATKIQPNLPTKSGVWYWINRWREEQLAQKRITYGDIVHQFIALSNKTERLPQIPSTKFNNFITDFLKAKQGSRAEAITAWEALKKANIPKTFSAWKQLNT